MTQTPDSPSLSAAQLATLTEIGEDRTANAGEVLYRVGDRDYPFVAATHQPEHLAAVRSMDHELLLKDAVPTVRTVKSPACRDGLRSWHGPRLPRLLVRRSRPTAKIG